MAVNLMSDNAEIFASFVQVSVDLGLNLDYLIDKKCLQSFWSSLLQAVKNGQAALLEL